MITVFTPAYNRAALLPRVYDSLCRQSSMDFEWIIVDDGSTDDTWNVVEQMISHHHAKFPIRYQYKENGGKHSAVNMGVREARGELFFILDSDDFLPADAVETVIREFEKVKKDHSIGGIAGLDIFENGETVGNSLPFESIDCNAIDIRYKYHITGDMKEVFRTSVLKEFPFPEISGERFCPEQLAWFRIAQKYKLHYINKPIYIAEYQNDGITAGITRARMKSPVASMMCYAELSRYDVPFVQKAKAAVNYWRFRFCAARGTKKPSINPLWAVVIPVAYLMHLKDKKSL